MRLLMSISIILSIISSACFAQSCGDPPSLPTKLEESESTKIDLDGKAQALSKYVGSAELGSAIQRERKTIFQSADKIAAAQKDAYLAYVFCAIIMRDSNLSTKEKLKALQEFRQPLSGSLESRPKAFLVTDAVDLPVSRGDLLNLYPNGKWIIEDKDVWMKNMFMEGNKEYEVSYFLDGELTSRIQLTMVYEYHRETKIYDFGQKEEKISMGINGKETPHSSQESIENLCNFDFIINKYKLFGGIMIGNPIEDSSEKDLDPACIFGKDCQLRSWENSLEMRYKDNNNMHTFIQILKDGMYSNGRFPHGRSPYFQETERSKCRLLIDREYH